MAVTLTHHASTLPGLPYRGQHGHWEQGREAGASEGCLLSARSLSCSWSCPRAPGPPPSPSTGPFLQALACRLS